MGIENRGVERGAKSPPPQQFHGIKALSSVTGEALPPPPPPPTTNFMEYTVRSYDIGLLSMIKSSNLRSSQYYMPTLILGMV